MTAAFFVELQSLRRSFGTRVAVDNLSVSIARGEIFGFLGPNGAGKSTTFHLLTGMLAPDSGEVKIDGRPAPPADPRTREKMGVVFQEPSLDDKLTGLENLELGAALYGLPRAEARERIAELLDVVDLKDRASEPVERYSGGMRRRLELARVLCHRPEILILDEPSRGIDQVTQRRIWSQLLELRQRSGTTILLTTHQPDEAEHCDRLAILDGGRVIACDTPNALRKQLGGDVITLEAQDPEGLGKIEEALTPFFAAHATVRKIGILDGKLVLEAAHGHEWIPRLVEALPPRSLRAVSLRQPTLGDVFVKMTGRMIEKDT